MSIKEDWKSDDEFEAPETDSDQYNANHRLVRKTMGKASRLPCFGECGKAGYDWAWVHGSDPSIVHNYIPLCRNCHREYDRADWLVEERREKLGRPKAQAALKGWSPERREAQRQRMLQKWSDPETRNEQSIRAKRDQPWKGRRPVKGGGSR